MLTRTAVINVVGLTESLLGPETPNLAAFGDGGARTRIEPAFPAVTCTALRLGASTLASVRARESSDR